MIPRGIYRNHNTGNVSPFILRASLRYEPWKGYRKRYKNSPQAKTIVLISINGSPAASSPCTSKKLFIFPDPYSIEKPKKNSTGAAMVLLPNFPIASPDTTTVYFVHIIDKNGCEYEDSVRVNVIPEIKLDIIMEEK